MASTTTRAPTRSGNQLASSAATHPPKLVPTTAGRSKPLLSMASQSQTTCSAIDVVSPPPAGTSRGPNSTRRSCTGNGRWASPKALCSHTNELTAPTTTVFALFLAPFPADRANGRSLGHHRRRRFALGRELGAQEGHDLRREQLHVLAGELGREPAQLEEGEQVAHA